MIKMHEMTVAKSMVRMIEAECHIRKITPGKVIVEIGKLTNYKKDPIMFYYDLFKKDAGLDGCELSIEEVDGRLACHDCRNNYDVDDPIIMFCPKCESTNFEIIQGKEIRIKDIITKNV